MVRLQKEEKKKKTSEECCPGALHWAQTLLQDLGLNPELVCKIFIPWTIQPWSSVKLPLCHIPPGDTSTKGTLIQHVAIPAQGCVRMTLGADVLVELVVNYKVCFMFPSTCSHAEIACLIWPTNIHIIACKTILSDLADFFVLVSWCISQDWKHTSNRGIFRVKPHIVNFAILRETFPSVTLFLERFSI